MKYLTQVANAYLEEEELIENINKTKVPCLSCEGPLRRGGEGVN